MNSETYFDELYVGEHNFPAQYLHTVFQKNIYKWNIVLNNIITAKNLQI